MLDSGAISALATNRGKAVVLVRELVERGWLLVLPAVVLIECLTGDPRRDANANRWIGAVGELRTPDEADARLAAHLRFRTRNPSVVDALVAAIALRSPGLCIVLTSDPHDLERLIAAGPARSEVRVLAC